MHNQRGFTLMELVVVIALLGIVAGISTQFFVNMASGYAGMARRHDLATTVQLGVEKIARELRLALPNSVRISGSCIEFIPVVGASRYTSFPAGATNSLTLIPLPSNGLLNSPPDPMYVSILDAAGVPTPNTDLYTLGSNMMLTPLSAAGRTAVIGGVGGSATVSAGLSASHTFPGAAGASNRIYVTSQPVSYCRVGSDLYRYANYGFNGTQATPPSPTSEPNRTLAATGLEASNTPFRSSVGGSLLTRSSLILIDLLITEQSESVQIQQLVQVRNG